MKGYGSFCPIAKAAEILSERWTFLILRELLLGARHFNDIRRGVPRISPTLLSKRLRFLCENGVIAFEQTRGVQGSEYRVTEAGEELRQFIELAGHWGQRWVRSRLTPEELNSGELMWYIHRHFQTDKLPPGRIVLHIHLTDVRSMKHWWLVVEGGAVDLCLDDPGHEIDIVMTTDLRSLAQIYIGDVSLARACAAGRVEILGGRDLVRSMPDWFARSKFASDNPMPDL